MKIVIFVWTRTVVNLVPDSYSNYWGLGDIIRGIINVYQICKKNNYEFIVDINKHEISKYLLIKEHNYSSIIDYNNIYFTNDPESYINKSENNIVYLLTNDFYKNEITEDCKLFLNTLLTPNNTFNEYMNNKLIEYNLNLELKNYSIIHFRLGDETLTKNIDTIKNNKNLEYYVNLFIKNKTEKNILFSDNNIFKTYMKENYNAFILDTKVTHIGYLHNINSIEDSLFEFFILLQVKEIKYYSIYNWISGFINSAHIINNIPLIELK